MTAPVDHLQALADLATPEGAWGYSVGQPAHPDPTCLALLALSAEPSRFRAAIDAGRAWLRSCAGADAAYRLPGGRYEAVWPTALTLFVEATFCASLADMRE